MSTSIHRRSFLGSAALGAAASGLNISAKNSARYDSPNSRVVIGIMGMSRGSRLAKNLGSQPNVDLKYICDVDSLRLEKVAHMVDKELGKTPRKVADFRRILEDPEVDALVNAGPNHWHAPATILACSAGKHVYVEKPCSHTPREGELMVEAARKYKRAVQMGTQRRSSPGTREAIQQLQEGAIGRVYMVRTWYNSGRGTLGKGKQVPVPAHLDYDLWQGPVTRFPYKDNLVHYNWHWHWHWGNGELGNNGVHTLDLCRWGLGTDYPIRVTSSGGRYLFDDDQETPDTHTVCYEFEGDRSITWAGLSNNRHSPGFITFYGDQGALDLETEGTYTIFDKDDKLVKKIASREKDAWSRAGVSYGDIPHAQNFLAAIRNDNPLICNTEIEEAHKTTLMCHLGNIAHRTGHNLTCDSSNGHILGDTEAMGYWSKEYAKGWEPKV